MRILLVTLAALFGVSVAVQNPRLLNQASSRSESAFGFKNRMLTPVDQAKLAVSKAHKSYLKNLNQ